MVMDWILSETFLLDDAAPSASVAGQAVEPKRAACHVCQLRVPGLGASIHCQGRHSCVADQPLQLQ